MDISPGSRELATEHPGCTSPHRTFQPSRRQPHHAEGEEMRLTPGRLELRFHRLIPRVSLAPLARPGANFYGPFGTSCRQSAEHALATSNH